MPQLHRLKETGRSHFVLPTRDGPFLMTCRSRNIRKFRRTILSQRSEDTAIFVFIVFFLPFSFSKSVIAVDKNMKLDEHDVKMIIFVALLHSTPLILWNMRLLRRNREIFEVMTMLETENEQQVRENDELKQESEELHREKSILITNNTELKSQKKKLESKLLKLEKKQKVLQNEFKTQKNKLVSEVKKTDKQNEEFKEEKEELISQMKELKLQFKNAEEKNLMLEEESLKMRTMTLELEKENDEKLCTVCLVDKKHILLQPCNHLCFCQKCFLHKKWSECPQCRQQIKSVINIFT